MHYTRLGQQTVNAVRFAELLQVLIRHGFADLLRRAGFQKGLPARMLRRLRLLKARPGEPETFGERLRAALVELGPTFIKFGQILSTRPDLVSHKIAEELSELQDQVDTVPFDKMRPVLETAFEGPYDKVLAQLDTEPIASASISQVYRGVLKTGEAVVLKVQRPGITKVIESDLGLMEQLAKWLDDHSEEAHWFDPVGIVDEFARSIRRELDFTIEARVIDKFRQNFTDDDRVIIPRVFHDICSQQVLVMDWIDGIRVDEVDVYPERRSDPHLVAEIGCDALCKMVFQHHLFHADPHPGNIFITYDNKLAFLDLGMAGHIESKDVGIIADLLLAIFYENSRDCVRAILRLTHDSEPENIQALEQEIAEYIAFEAQSIVGGGQVAKGIDRATQILRSHHIELAPRFSLLLKALATIENVGKSLDPHMDMAPIIQPYVEKLINRRYIPRYVIKDAWATLRNLGQVATDIPSDISFMLRQLRRGKLKVQIHHEHLENLAATIDRASSRITVGLIVAALIVGSSLMISQEGPFSHLGTAGFVFAGVLGTTLVVNILWSRRF